MKEIFIIKKASRAPLVVTCGPQVHRRLKAARQEAYAGPACEYAGVEPGKVYEDVDEAILDAGKLSSINPVGFDVYLIDEEGGISQV